MQRRIVKPSLCLDMSHAAKSHRAVTLVPSPPQDGSACPFPRCDSDGSSKRRRPNLFNATPITPGVYLGSFTDAMQRAEMLELGITHILNVAREVDSEHSSDSEEAHTPSTLFTFLKIDVTDHSDEDIGSHFKQCLDFIHAAQAMGGKVLVHCRQGVSRSPTIVIAYLMKSMGLSLDDALHFVQSKRESVCPNIGFILTLEEYQSCGAQEFHANSCQGRDVVFDSLALKQLGCFPALSLSARASCPMLQT